MPIKKYKPVSPGSRFHVGNKFEELTGDKPTKSLLAPIKKSGGRNGTGKMTVRQKGGGHKRRYRIVDFRRNNDGIACTVKTIEYDPNRTAFIALLENPEGKKSYIIAPQGLTVGDVLHTGKDALPTIGNCLFLGDVPLGNQIHAIELQPGKGAALARSAGTNATLMGKEGKFVSVKLPSGEVRRILKTCRATIGTTSNPDHSLTVAGKAGRNRWKGIRPRVRGVAMNPVDHPMGGGEGKASGGHPRSRTGIMSKGQKTRDVNKASNKLIITRRKTKNKK